MISDIFGFILMMGAIMGFYLAFFEAANGFIHCSFLLVILWFVVIASLLVKFFDLHKYETYLREIIFRENSFLK